jgi:hypothetical protein
MSYAVPCSARYYFWRVDFYTLYKRYLQQKPPALTGERPISSGFVMILKIDNIARGKNLAELQLIHLIKSIALLQRACISQLGCKASIYERFP